MKIKNLRDFCNKYDDNLLVGFCTYSYNSEEYTEPVKVRLVPRLPKRTDFDHIDCKNHEIIDIKGKEREFCNYKDKFFSEYTSYHSCENFEPKNDVNINYCLECDPCYWNHYCKGIKKGE